MQARDKMVEYEDCLLEMSFAIGYSPLFLPVTSGTARKKETRWWWDIDCCVWDRLLLAAEEAGQLADSWQQRYGAGAWAAWWWWGCYADGAPPAPLCTFHSIILQLVTAPPVCALSQSWDCWKVVNPILAINHHDCATAKSAACSLLGIMQHNLQISQPAPAPRTLCNLNIKNCLFRYRWWLDTCVSV